MTRKTTITVAVSALVVALAIGASVAGAKPGRATAPVSTQAKYTIALSNSFIGNKWRIEMENVFKSACGMPPYKTQVAVLRLQLGQRRHEADAADLEPDLAGRRRDPASTPRRGTGLNGIIEQACARGIVVVAYDNLVTAPCALKINGEPVLLRPAERASTSPTSSRARAT